MKEETAKLLLEIKAVDLNTESGFTYTSGRQGPIYCDNRLVLSYPKQRDALIGAFVKLINEKKLEFDIVAGVATGAIAWGALVAEKLNKPFIYIRASAKEHGKGNQIEGELQEGKRVLVIEDLINTGGSSVAACNAVTEEAGKVVACVAIFSYGHDDAAKKFVEAKVPLYSLSHFDTLLKVALETKFITEENKKSLLEWHKNPKEWKPQNG
jgi:orotate phosphoribosyltransferase